MHKRIICEVPRVWMDCIDPPERGEELPAFQLQIERQTRRLHECFFDFHFGSIVVIQFENDVGETFEVRIDRAVERELDIARVETTLLRIVVTYFDVVEIARAGISEREQPVERDVHVILAAADRDWLR